MQCKEKCAQLKKEILSRWTAYHVDSNWMVIVSYIFKGIHLFLASLISQIQRNIFLLGNPVEVYWKMAYVDGEKKKKCLSEICRYF